MVLSLGIYAYDRKTSDYLGFFYAEPGHVVIGKDDFRQLYSDVESLLTTRYFFQRWKDSDYQGGILDGQIAS